MLRAELAGDAIRRQLLIPVAGAARVPVGIVVPYASLLLEARTGTIGVVPSEALPAGPPPTDAEINAFYTQEHRPLHHPRAPRRPLRAVRPRRRSSRRSRARPRSPPSTRPTPRATPRARRGRLQQIILPDQAAANAFVAKVKGGTAFTAAAQAAGFTAADTALGEIARDKLAAQASPAVAAAAFAAPSGQVTAPVKARARLVCHQGRCGEAGRRPPARSRPRARSPPASASRRPTRRSPRASPRSRMRSPTARASTMSSRPRS